MRRITLFLLIFCLIGIMSTENLVAQNKPAPVSDPRRNQIFRAIYPQEPQNLDPHAAKPDPAAVPVIMAAYERLVYLKADNARPHINSSLVKAYRISPDGKTYTFVLQEGRTFSDGTPITSESLLYSFDRLMSSSTGEEFFPYLSNFKVLSANSFALILRRPWSPFLASLALPQASLVSPGAASQPADYLQKHTLGSGQYKLYDWRNQTIGLMSRPELSIQPRVSYVMFHYEPDPAKRYSKMLAHHAHLTVDPSIGMQQQQALPNGFITKKMPTYKVRYVAFNCERSFMRMQSIRRALASLVKSRFAGKEASMSGIFPPGLFYSNRGESNQMDYNPLEQARYVLQEISKPKEALILAYKKDDSLAEEASIIAQTLHEHGLECSLTPLSGKAGRNILNSGGYDMLLSEGSPVIPAPEMWISPLLHSGSSARGNPAFFRNLKADELINEMTSLHMDETGSPKEILSFFESQKAEKLNELSKLTELDAPYGFLYAKELTVVLSDLIAGQEKQPNAMWPDVWDIASSDLTPLDLRPKTASTAKRPQLENSPNTAVDDLSLFRPPTSERLKIDSPQKTEKPAAPGLSQASGPSEPAPTLEPDKNMLPPPSQKNYNPEFIEGVLLDENK